MFNQKKINIKYKMIAGIFIALIILTGLFFLYVSDYYSAVEESITESSREGIQVSATDDMLIADPGNAKKALIFYPGGKVEYKGYGPLMTEIAKEGILCAVPKMPFHLAVFDSNKAEEIIADYPNIEEWYIGGHSLGGSMAAGYASKNSEKLEGVILLASYSASDISTEELEVLSIYGDRDQILNLEAYEKNKENLPEDFTEIVIKGANHAGFGDYGPQSGDGKAEISSKEQQISAGQSISDFILETK